MYVYIYKYININKNNIKLFFDFFTPPILLKKTANLGAQTVTRETVSQSLSQTLWQSNLAAGILVRCCYFPKCFAEGCAKSFADGYLFRCTSYINIHIYICIDI